MKNAFVRSAVALTLGAVGAVLLPQEASAQSIVSASICKPRESGDSGLSAGGWGVVNTNSSSISVVCPGLRLGPAGPSGLNVWVDGRAAGGTQIYCSLDSYNQRGKVIGSTSFTASGYFEKLLTLAPNLVTDYSSVALNCILPGNSKGYLFDIQALQ